MGDKHQDRWERREARWEARRAKWEARHARHKARQEAHEARRAARHAGREAGRTRGSRTAGRTSPVVGLAALGGSLLLLGLFSALTSGGPAVTIPLCFAPGAVLLGIALLVRAYGSKTPRAAQDIPQTAAQRAEAAQGAQPSARQAAAAPGAPRAAAVSQPLGSEAGRDPSYYRQRAAGYRRRIQSIIKSRRPGPLADVMSSVVGNLERWEERVGQLADRLATFEGDAIIQRDLKEVPADIGRLRGQIEAETDPEMRMQMERTMAGYQSQQKLLDTLVRVMRSTRLQLDDTLVAMGTIYSQVQVLDAMDIDSAKTARIAEEIEEQVQRLNDLLSAVGDVYHRPDQAGEPADAARRIRLEGGQAAG